MRARVFETLGGSTRIPSSFFDDLVEIFEENWLDITDDHKRMSAELDMIVKKEILSQMEKEMKF